jgi:hypothetical protein
MFSFAFLNFTSQFNCILTVRSSGCGGGKRSCSCSGQGESHCNVGNEM